MSSYTKIYYKESISNTSDNESYLNRRVYFYQDNLPVNYWFEKYFIAIFCMAIVYDHKNPYCMNSMMYFIYTLSNIIPNQTYKLYFKRFLNMTPDVLDELKQIEILARFFYVNKDFYDSLRLKSKTLFTDCLNNNEMFFKYVYTLYIYLLSKQNIQGYTYFPSYNEIKDRYSVNKITKSLWGNNTWFIIHTSALYLPRNVSKEVFNNWRSFLKSLTYILPCKKCQEHLKDNIRFINLDNCGEDNFSAFKCTWNLHNIVNRSLNKDEISFIEALKIYIPVDNKITIHY